MPTVDLGAELSVRGLSGFKKGMKEAGDAGDKTRGKLGRLGKAGRSALDTIGKRSRSLVRGIGSVTSAVTKLTAGVTALGAVSVKKFGDFDMSMARVQTVLPQGVSAMESFGQEVLDNSVRFGQSIENVSGSLFQSLSAGISGSQAEMQEYNRVLGEAATGGFTRMEVVADGLTNTMNAYGLAIGSARTVSDDFFVANRLGKTTFEELAGTMGRVAPMANALGVSYRELLASIVSMTKAGVQTSESVSSLKQVFANIARPTKDAASTAKKLGLNFGIAGLQSKGLSGFLEELIVKTDGNTDAQIALFGSVESFNAIARLTSKEGAAEFRGAMDALRDSAGATSKAFDDVRNTTGFKLQQLKAGLERFAVEIGGGIVEGLGLDRIGDIPDAMNRAAKTVRSAAKSFAEGFREAFQPMWDAVGQDWDGLARTIGEAAGNIVTAFVKIAEIIVSLVNSEGFKMLFMVLGGGTGDILQGIGQEKQIRESFGRSAGFDRPSRLMAGITSEATILTDPKLMASVVQSIEKEARDTAIKAFEARGQQVFAQGEFGAVGLAGGATPETIEKEIATQRARIWAEEWGMVSEQTIADAVSNSIAPIGDWLAAAMSRETEAQAQEQRKVEAEAALPPGSFFDKPTWNVTVGIANEFIAKGKRGGGRGGFSARGRGNANIQAASEQQFLLMDNQIVAMDDQFHFARQHLGGEGETGASPTG